MGVSETTVDMLDEYIRSVFASQYGVCYPGKSDGAGGWVIECSNDPGRWWIRTWKNGVVAVDKATPMGVPRDPQQRCMTRVVNGERIIEMPDPTSLRQLYGAYSNDAAVNQAPKQTSLSVSTAGAVGIVSPSSAGGMNVRVSAYPAGKLLADVDPIDLSGDEPGSANEFLWDIAYIDTSGVVQWAQSSPVTLAAASALDILQALAVTLPNSTYRLFAVSLGHGQTDIHQSVFVDLQDDLAKPGVVESIVAGIGVTVDSTDPANPIVSAASSSAIGTVLWDKTLSGAGTFDTNSADDHGNSGLFATTYLWLEILYDVRGAKAATGVSLRIALNNDSTDSNYQAVTAFQGSSGGGALNDNNRVVTEAPGDSATANYFGQGRATIYNPGSAHFKSVTTFGSDPRSTSDHHVDENSVLWRDTSAISRIALDVSDGTTTTFVTGSRLTVIGYS